jgi:hypothetical protein
LRGRAYRRARDRGSIVRTDANSSTATKKLIMAYTALSRAREQTGHT